MEIGKFLFALFILIIAGYFLNYWYHNDSSISLTLDNKFCAKITHVTCIDPTFLSIAFTIIGYLIGVGFILESLKWMGDSLKNGETEG